MGAGVLSPGALHRGRDFLRAGALVPGLLAARPRSTIRSIFRTGHHNYGTISSTLTMDVNAWPARSRTGFFCLATISSKSKGA